MNKITTFQIGKEGITAGTIQGLTLRLVTHKFIRISVLKASGRDKSSIKTMAESLIKQLPYPCTTSIIGFTIILRKRSAHIRDIPSAKS